MTDGQIKTSFVYWYQCKARAAWKVIQEAMFVFEMPKVVHIRNPALGLLFRSVQVAILTYFLFFVMWWNKGYQSKDKSIGGVTAKVSGIAWFEIPYNLHKPTFLILDKGSYNFRSLQNSGLYLVTRVHGIEIQTLGFCAEADTLVDARCLRDEHCPVGSSAGLSVIDFRGYMLTNDEINLHEDGHGIFTGRCLNETKTCEIYGWCRLSGLAVGNSIKQPTDRLLPPPNVLEEPFSHFADLNFLYERKKLTVNDTHTSHYLKEILNFTILIKNAIEFPYFGVKRRNILPWMTEVYLKQCRYNPEHLKDKYCPVFFVRDMLRLAGVDWRNLFTFGGVMAITVDWQCDLDWSVDYCLPDYTFRQLEVEYEIDNQAGPTDVTLSEGSSQQIIIKMETDVQLNRYRTLMQVSGITFLIRVTGEAGKFNLLEFTMRFGSGMALLGGATIICDLIVFHFLRDRHRYKQATCDDKTLRRLLKMAAEAQMPRSRRTKLRESFMAPRKTTSVDRSDVAAPNTYLNHHPTVTVDSSISLSSRAQYQVLNGVPGSESSPMESSLQQVCSFAEIKLGYLHPNSQTATTPSSVTSIYFAPPERDRIVESPFFAQN
ncbi:hypothetical protein CRM22_002620 [Opisthorchis felineus]|uniref:P2X purinoceptor 4 n=1 Tax=Opisthorchis felineus TaxID=147828 RepID=A0A4S2MB78_OPIFE|nr:hypothetical protein CRM22_002620 [Opisthorchis felineus]